MSRLARMRTALAALLLGTALALPLTHGLAPQAAHAADSTTAHVNGYFGTWRNADPNTRGIAVIQVTKDPFWGTQRIDVWGTCHPVDCYWGHSWLSYNLGATLAYSGVFYNLPIPQDVELVRVGQNMDVADEFDPYPWQAGHFNTIHYTFVRST